MYKHTHIIKLTKEITNQLQLTHPTSKELQVLKLYDDGQIDLTFYDGLILPILIVIDPNSIEKFVLQKIMELCFRHTVFNFYTTIFFILKSFSKFISIFLLYSSIFYILSYIYTLLAVKYVQGFSVEFNFLNNSPWKTQNHKHFYQIPNKDIWQKQAYNCLNYRQVYLQCLCVCVIIFFPI